MVSLFGRVNGERIKGVKPAERRVPQAKQRKRKAQPAARSLSLACENTESEERKDYAQAEVYNGFAGAHLCHWPISHSTNGQREGAVSKNCGRPEKVSDQNKEIIKRLGVKELRMNEAQ